MSSQYWKELHYLTEKTFVQPQLDLAQHHVVCPELILGLLQQVCLLEQRVVWMTFSHLSHQQVHLPEVSLKDPERMVQKILLVSQELFGSPWFDQVQQQ